jgi:hypothetical protein
MSSLGIPDMNPDVEGKAKDNIKQYVKGKRLKEDQIPAAAFHETGPHKQATLEGQFLLGICPTVVSVSGNERIHFSFKQFS